MAAARADVFLPAAGTGGAKAGGKLLGLPTWGLVLVAVGGLVVGYVIYKRVSSGAGAASAAPANPASSGVPIDASGGSGAPLPTDTTPQQSVAEAPDFQGLVDALTGAITTAQTSATAAPAPSTTPSFFFLLPNTPTTTSTISSSPLTPIINPATGKPSATVSPTSEGHQTIGSILHPPAQSTSTPEPIAIPESVSGSFQASPEVIAAFHTATPVTPPTYGITYGPPAGQRGSVVPGRGVISIH